MFTGIVAGLGSVTSVDETAAGRRLRIRGGAILDAVSVGDSVAVNGVCLTATEVEGEPAARTVTVEVVGETLARTTLGDLAVGDRVDLERPMAADGRFDGHMVQGHVDGVGRVVTVIGEGDARRVRIELPDGLGKYVVEKGSVAVDGVSLTVTATDAAGTWFEVVLIPHTLEVTALGQRTVGSQVNLEVDVLAKYVERLLEARP